ncbi:FAD binding domain protein [Lophium mytilinum]|uniref:FAD binding domain protein n=1 Tax=Lophium mytilinum TaxID=390894 RepID=A0A6A6R8Y5_9PEZI|nr:FAD binding domain protein [Lophium mytilinum]
MVSIETSLPIVWRSNPHGNEYERARVGRVFNARRPKRFPRAVVEATTESQVVEAVRLAIREKCRVSVRSGGHSWAAWSVRDDAILIDLGRYQHLELDEGKKAIIVSPSTTGRVLNGLLSTRGLMFAGGHCPDVGVGGFLLQGGMGWNCKNWGWACEQVVAIDAVDAWGELLHCDTEQNSDLFWAARGAGPGFPGVITKFYLRVRPAYTNVLNSLFFYPISEYRRAMDWVIKASPTFDEDTEIVAIGAVAPPETGISGHCVLLNFLTFKNDEEEAKSALLPANTGRPQGFALELTNQPSSLADQYRIQAGANPEGHRYCAENAYIKNDADVPAVMEDAFTTAPHPKAFCIWYAMAPCSRRPLPDMALSTQSDHYFALYTVWEHESDDERCQSWVSNTMRKVERHSDGAYLGDSDFQVRRTRFWADANAERLMDIRRKYDPEGRICGYLDIDDASGVKGLENRHEWMQ